MRKNIITALFLISVSVSFGFYLVWAFNYMYQWAFRHDAGTPFLTFIVGAGFAGFLLWVLIRSVKKREGKKTFVAILIGSCVYMVFFAGLFIYTSLGLWVIPVSLLIGIPLSNYVAFVITGVGVQKMLYC